MMSLSRVSCMTKLILENSGLCIYMLPLVERYTTFSVKSIVQILFKSHQGTCLSIQTGISHSLGASLVPA